MYENFSATSTEFLDSIFNKLQKIISQLAVLDTMSIDDLYNNFKIVEQEVKRTTSSNSSSQNMAFVSSPSINSINGVHIAYEVSTAGTQPSTASTQVNTGSSQTSIANLSDATMYAFLANQSNGSQLVHEDLEQIYEDDLEEMDLKWQLALLSMRAKRFFQKTRKKITINGSDTAGFDKSKKKPLPKLWLLLMELVLTEDEAPTNMALMAFSDSESLDKLIRSQITDNSKKGLGYKSYHAVPPPPIGLFLPPKLDLSNSGLEEFKQPEFESYRPNSCEKESNNASKDIPNELKESPDAPLVKDRVLDNKDFSVKSPVEVKTVNGEAQIQALVDKKKVIIIETSVRSNLHLEDAEGSECLPTATIFKQLRLMGAKTTAWNEFSSTMASAIICLATNTKFNFSKYIFDYMVKNLEDGVKFLMFPRFVQVFLDIQIEGMLKHKEIYVTPSHTKKIFANMKRQGKDFSSKVTPLFETMMFQPQEDIGEDSDIQIDSHHKPIVTQPCISSQPQQKQQSKKSNKMITEVPQLSESTHDVVDYYVTTISNDPLSADQALEIGSLKRRVKKLEKKASKKTHKLKRLYKIGSSTRVEKSSEDAGLGDQEDASKQRRMVTDLDADEGVALVDETQGRNDQDMFDTSIFDDEEVVVEEVVAAKEVSTADPVTTAGEVVTTAGIEVNTAAITSQISMDDITLAKALVDIKTSKPKAKGIVIQEPSETSTQTPIDSSQQSLKAKDKDKAKMIEPEKPLKKKDQIMIDEEVARNLEAQMQAKLKEEERLTTQKEEEASIANTENYKHSQSKNKSFEEIQVLFNNTMKWIESFVPMDTELVKGSEKAAEGSKKAEEGSSKRAGDNLEQEDAKRQRIEEENESA
nr:hypothetical protein [Tanacetum cinerariifolium]